MEQNIMNMPEAKIEIKIDCNYTIIDGDDGSYAKSTSRFGLRKLQNSLQENINNQIILILNFSNITDDFAPIEVALAILAKYNNFKRINVTSSDNNKLGCADILDSIVAIIKANPELEDFEIKITFDQEKDYEQLQDVLIKNTNITLIKFLYQSDEIGKKEKSILDIIKGFMETNQKLKAIATDNNDITKIVIQGGGRGDVKRERKSCIHFNTIRAEKLIAILKEKPGLRDLVFKNCRFSKEALPLLIDYIKDTHNIEGLTLGELNLMDEDINELLTGLKDHPCMQVLNLSRNNISNNGAESIAKKLIAQKNCLHELDLSDNKIASDGIEHIAKELGKNNTIHTLDLSSNKVSSEALMVLANNLVHNKTLNTLIINETALNLEVHKRFINKNLVEEIHINNFLLILFPDVSAKSNKTNKIINNTFITNLEMPGNINYSTKANNVNSLIKRYLDKNKTYSSMLITAIKNENISDVDDYLRMASLYTFDSEKNSLLHLAVKKINPILVETILGHGIDTNLRNKDNKTALDLVYDLIRPY